MSNIRNVGILAHVDAGKTTLTEQLLYAGGALRAPGRVDDGNTYTDSMTIERQRGISVASQAAAMMYRGVTIHLIDTPGHVDFSPEVENALLALDGAVLVLSAAEGVQARTTVLLRTLQSMGIPTVIFVNKLDRMGASPEKVLEQLSELTKDALPLQRAVDAGGRTASVVGWHDDPVMRAAIIDRLTTLDDDLLERELSNLTNDADIEASLTKASYSAKIIPVLFGAALRGIGVWGVLDAIVDLLPPPQGDPGAPLSAIIYKISRHKGRRVHVRLFSGAVDCKTLLQLSSGSEKPQRLMKLRQGGYFPATSLCAGEIGVLLGVDGGHPGEWLGEPRRQTSILAQRAISVTVAAQSGSDLTPLRDALMELCDEDPALDFRYQTRTREFTLNIMGEIHQEVLQSVLLERFGLVARFSQPSVIYREQPVRSGEGNIEMFFSPWYACATFRVEPLPLGSGVVYETLVSTDWLYLRYQNEVRTAALETLNQGLHGWEVTDCRLSLTDARCISVIMPSSCFAPVIPMAVMDALAAAGTTLLEPMLSFELTAPARCVGNALYDLQRMRAVCQPPVTSEEIFTVQGVIPVATSMGYGIRLASLSGGTGVWLTQFSHYAPCAPELGHRRTRDTADPLHRDEYVRWLKLDQP